MKNYKRSTKNLKSAKHSKLLKGKRKTLRKSLKRLKRFKYVNSVKRLKGGRRKSLRKSLKRLKKRKTKQVGGSGKTRLPVTNPFAGTNNASAVSITKDIVKKFFGEEIPELEHFHYNIIKVGDELGKGRFGKVIKGILQKNQFLENSGVEVALKQCTGEIDYCKSEQLNELKVMMKLNKKSLQIPSNNNINAENVLGIYGITADPVSKNIYLVMEICKGSLYRALKEWNTNDEDGTELWFNKQKFQDYMYDTNNVIPFSLDIAKGMSYLHKKGIIHGDLACRNILISNIDTAKISDFGSSKILDPPPGPQFKVANSNTLYPLRWSDPELLSTHTYRPECDIWSYGMVLIEIMLNGTKLYTTEKSKSQMDGYTGEDDNRDEEWRISISELLFPSPLPTPHPRRVVDSSSGLRQNSAADDAADPLYVAPNPDQPALYEDTGGSAAAWAPGSNGAHELEQLRNRYPEKAAKAIEWYNSYVSGDPIEDEYNLLYIQLINRSQNPPKNFIHKKPNNCNDTRWRYIKTFFDFWRARRPTFDAIVKNKKFFQAIEYSTTGAVEMNFL